MMQRLSLPQFTVTRTTRSQRRNIIVRAEEQPPLPPVDPQEKASKGSTSQVREVTQQWCYQADPIALLSCVACSPVEHRLSIKQHA